ncbi:hypothetical protein [Methylobacterium tarhaniae]|uniref:hypothetical protein n=1 Tax=Methylobacterium tarhaniae TaxID=1187852 RepID=UPI003D095224
MNQAVESADHRLDHEELRKWLYWRGGAYEYFAGLARLDLMDCDHIVLDEFLLDYGVALKCGYGSDDAEWLIKQMPDGPSFYTSEEHAAEEVRFLARLKGDCHSEYTEDQLRKVAYACVERAQSLIQLAQEITAGKFKFPDAETSTAG